MSQSESSKATAAEERSEQTRSLIRTVKAATRRKHPHEEKICIVLEGFRREVTVNDLCRREGSNPTPTTPGPKNSWKPGKSG